MLKASAGFHSRRLYCTTTAATAFTAFGVGYEATREKLLRRGSKPDQWLRSELAGHANH